MHYGQEREHLARGRLGMGRKKGKGDEWLPN